MWRGAAPVVWLQHHGVSSSRSQVSPCYQFPSWRCVASSPAAQLLSAGQCTAVSWLITILSALLVLCTLLLPGTGPWYNTEKGGWWCWYCALECCFSCSGYLWVVLPVIRMQEICLAVKIANIHLIFQIIWCHKNGRSHLSTTADWKLGYQTVLFSDRGKLQLQKYISCQGRQSSGEVEREGLPCVSQIWVSHFSIILLGICKTTGITLGHNILILMEILLMSSMRNR